MKEELRQAIIKFHEAADGDSGDDEYDAAVNVCEVARNFSHETGIMITDLRMIIQKMVRLHRQSNLDEAYCLKALDYLKRKGLEGSVLR